MSGSKNPDNPKLLVSGLCLQGNKGGPALALCLIELVHRYIPGAEFTFAVPGGIHWESEQRWAREYGVNAVQRLSARGLRKTSLSVKRNMLSAVRHHDAVIDLSAIAYVGPPLRSSFQTVLSGRFVYFMLSRLFRKPFIAWTQSYGPFSSGTVRTLAKMDLSRQSIIYCRGEDCLKTVHKLLPSKHALSFPDAAIILPYDKEWGISYLAARFPNIDRARLVTVSPSAALYCQTQGSNSANQHIRSFATLCDELSERGYDVLMVPHTLMSYMPHPNTCDLAVCNLVQRSMANPVSSGIVDEDLSPSSLKSIISQATIHISGRYHSLIAGLSSGVPSIAASWHDKYKDILRIYNMEEYGVDSLRPNVASAILERFDQEIKERDKLVKILLDSQVQASSEVAENARMFADNLRGMIS